MMKTPQTPWVLILLMSLIFFLGIFAPSVVISETQKPPTEDELVRLLTPLSSVKIDEFKKFGPNVLPVLTKVYGKSDLSARATIAWIFYELRWPSKEAKAALMKDVHTPDSKLRLQVQWALGRVSADPDVVKTLLENMQNDNNPLFRDKAACALASDQIHLTEKQKFQLYEGLIKALEDSKPDVRSIAIKALQIQTGQDKGFSPNAPEEQRKEKLREWKQWLQKYQSALL